MKKLLITSAILLATTGAFAQPSNMGDTTPGTYTQEYWVGRTMWGHTMDKHMRYGHDRADMPRYQSAQMPMNNAQMGSAGGYYYDNNSYYNNNSMMTERPNYVGADNGAMTLPNEANTGVTVNGGGGTK